MALKLKCFFKNLFRKKTPVQTAVISTIDITESGLVINGEPVDVPIHISGLKGIFGEPRVIGFKTEKEDREFLEQLHGNGMVTKRVNYTWDDLGIYCYTHNGAVVNSIGIRLSKQGDTYKYTPEKTYKGTVTIEGRPWFEAINKGEDMEFFRRCELGPYSIVSEYADPFDDGERTEKDYVDLEINLKLGG
ncbi:MAG: hypothetical protein IJD85_09130 [Oscillospiraceae bacterium]|nr:hypothetical protein [Oscillospiraceae bacterium]